MVVGDREKRATSYPGPQRALKAVILPLRASNEGDCISVKPCLAWVGREGVKGHPITVHHGQICHLVQFTVGRHSTGVGEEHKASR